MLVAHALPWTSPRRIRTNQGDGIGKLVLNFSPNLADDGEYKSIRSGHALGSQAHGGDGSWNQLRHQLKTNAAILPVLFLLAIGLRSIKFMGENDILEEVWTSLTEAPCQ